VVVYSSGEKNSLDHIKNWTFSVFLLFIGEGPLPTQFQICRFTSLFSVWFLTVSFDLAVQGIVYYEDLCNASNVAIAVKPIPVRTRDLQILPS